MASHQCQVDEIILDQDDTLRSQVLEQVLNDIRIQYLPFKQDQREQNEVMFNLTLDQKAKLEMVHRNKEFHESLKKKYTGKRGYELFKEIMNWLLEDLNQKKEAREKGEKLIKQQKEEFRLNRNSNKINIQDQDNSQRTPGVPPLLLPHSSS